MLIKTKKMNIAIGILLCASIFLFRFQHKSFHLFIRARYWRNSRIHQFVCAWRKNSASGDIGTKASLRIERVVDLYFGGVCWRYLKLGQRRIFFVGRKRKVAKPNLLFLPNGWGWRTVDRALSRNGKVAAQRRRRCRPKLPYRAFLRSRAALVQLSPAFHPVTEISDQVIVQIMILVFAVFSSLMTLLSALSEENSRGKTVWVYLFHGNIRFFAMACVGFEIDIAVRHGSDRFRHAALYSAQKRTDREYA